MLDSHVYRKFLPLGLIWQSSIAEVRVRFLGEQNILKLANSNFVNFLLKTNYERDRRLNFDIFVVWSASYVLA